MMIQIVRSKGKGEENNPDNAPDALRRMGFFFGGIFVLGLLAAVTQAHSVAEGGLILTWSLASVISGGAIGFLFGVPKIVQSDQTTPSTDTSPGSSTPDSKQPVSLQGTYRQQVNTNLTEISDWLTKIIVGLGLINLSHVPVYLSDTAGALAAGIGGAAPARALAMGIVVSFSLGGFLFGYLTTRLFLAEALSHADQAALAAIRDVKQQAATTRAQVAQLESRQSVLKEAVRDAQATKSKRLDEPQLVDNLSEAERPAPRATQDELLAQLELMAKDYLDIRAQDWAERVQRKDQAAAEMASFVLVNDLPHDSLVALAKKTRNEGIVLALATAANTQPERDDLARLMDVGQNLTRLHVKYHVLVAVGTLVRSGFVPREKLDDVRRFVQSYSAGADSSLSKLVADTIALIDSAIQQQAQNTARAAS